MRMSRRLIGASAGFLCLLCVVVDAQEMSIGINLNRISDYNPSWVFTDVMKQSRPWISFAFNTVSKQETWNAGGPVDVDELGYPRSLRSWKDEQGNAMQQRLGTLIFREIGDAYPGGIYRAEWRGDAILEFGLSASVIREGKTGDQSWADVRVTPKHSGILLKIVAMNPADPIRDLHLWFPEDDNINRTPWKVGDPHSPFHPLFKERLKPFSTLRLVDWTATNWTEPHSWQERTTPAHVRQSGDKNGKGAALEYGIRLANELNKDVWVNTPPWADDDYVREMAILLREQLSPDQKIYVEWANELWNFAAGFATFPWLKNELKKSENESLSHWQLAAKHIQRDLEIWSEVFKDEPHRIVRVVAGQSSNPWVTKELVKHVRLENIDAISCAAYVQFTDEQRAGFDAATTAADIIKAGKANLSRNQEELAAHKRLADTCSKIAKRPIKLVAYEGGQHFDAKGRKVPYLDALYEAQQHPDMEFLYDELLNVVKKNGFELFNHYAYVGRDSPYGSWSVLSRQDQDPKQSPKYRALIK